ncbi:MAG: hypothetical protein QOH26_1835, partial [Actinomycetota bacterium]|nr:hypothetical protein [Actinomycetota bacterium]
TERPGEVAQGFLPRREKERSDGATEVPQPPEGRGSTSEVTVRCSEEASAASEERSDESSEDRDEELRTVAERQEPGTSLGLVLSVE